MVVETGQSRPNAQTRWNEAFVSALAGSIEEVQMKDELAAVTARIRKDRAFAELTVAQKGRNLAQWTNLSPPEIAHALREAHAALSPVSQEGPTTKLTADEVRKAVATMGRADLTEFDLSGLILDYFDLTGVILTRANLSRARMIYAKLWGANLEGATLSDANLEHAYLAGAILTEANLSNANLREANLNRETYRNAATLYRANLTGASLYQAKLTEADFSGATLRSADLRGVSMHRATLYKADLRGARISGSLSGTSLVEANLCGADLTNATLADCRWESTTYNDQTIWPDGFILAVVPGLKKVEY